MNYYYFSIIVLTSAVTANDCNPNPIERLYIQMGCEPKNEQNSGCPTSYDCSAYESREKDKCHYLGKTYAVGEELSGTTTESCKAACKCMASFDGGAPSFTCANIECPELFRRPEPECRLIYEHDKCCSTGKVCGDEVKKAKVTCQYNNETYIAGERIRQDTCQTCYCQENFEGLLKAPFCREIMCHDELSNASYINRGCVPVYLRKQGCCPIEYKCPSKNDQVRRQRNKKRPRTSAKCKFGSLVLEANQRLETTDGGKTDCSCQVPPYLTCTYSSG